MENLMRKLTTYLTLILATFLIAGCGQKHPDPIVTEALFCDVEELRRFSKEEVIWRTENAPWNFRRDLKTNLTFERECVD